MKQIAALISYDMTAEEEIKIISSFTEEQKAFFQKLLADCILSKAEIKISAERPYAHVQASANLDGRQELLEILLTKFDTTAATQNSQENQNG